MIRQFLGALSALVLAGVVLGGCQTTPEEEPPQTVVDDPPKMIPTTPAGEPDPPLPFTPDLKAINKHTGELLDAIFYFEYDQARLAQADLVTLALHAEILRDHRNRSVQIEGHCDERGTREYNLALGERRSEAVRRYLISAGVRATQVETVSYGEERPVDPGHDENAWAQNRRAVMIYR